MRLTSAPPAVPAARYSGALSTSAVIHVGVVVLAGLLARGGPAVPPESVARAEVPTGIVWIAAAQPGPSAGGGGGGEESPEPPRALQLEGRDPVAVPVMKALVPAPEAADSPPVTVPPLDISAVAMARGLEDLPGLMMAPAAPGGSRGPGRGPGAGDGRGPGIGPGEGPGLGPGKDGGLGGIGPPGHGVSEPLLVHEVRPNYTNGALQAKVQGIVALEAIVLADGRVGQVDVIRSLDRTFGLDGEAMAAVRQWRFKPAMHLGHPVPVRVQIELTFTLR
jgi:protein TonB